MIIGTCRATLFIPGNHSLKGKRGVIKPLIAQVRKRFNVSIAEVDSQDLWQRATLGLACVSNGSRHAQETLDEVLRFIAEFRPDVELIDSEIEVL